MSVGRLVHVMTSGAASERFGVESRVREGRGMAPWVWNVSMNGAVKGSFPGECIVRGKKPETGRRDWKMRMFFIAHGNGGDGRGTVACHVGIWTNV